MTHIRAYWDEEDIKPVPPEDARREMLELAIKNGSVQLVEG